MLPGDLYFQANNSFHLKFGSQTPSDCVQSTFKPVTATWNINAHQSKRQLLPHVRRCDLFFGGLITSAYLPLNLPSWHIIYRHNPLITNKQTAFTTCSFFHHMRIPQFLTSQLETDVFLSTLFILILFIRMSSNGVSAQLQHP